MEFGGLTNAMLPFFTGIAAWAVYPEPPQFIKDLAQYEWFRYLLVFTLIYQGLGKQNVGTALTTTVAMFLVKRLLDKPLPSLYGGDSEEKK